MIRLRADDQTDSVAGACRCQRYGTGHIRISVNASSLAVARAAAEGGATGSQTRVASSEALEYLNQIARAAIKASYNQPGRDDLKAMLRTVRRFEIT